MPERRVRANPELQNNSQYGSYAGSVGDAAENTAESSTNNRGFFAGGVGGTNSWSNLKRRNMSAITDGTSNTLAICEIVVGSSSGNNRVKGGYIQYTGSRTVALRSETRTIATSSFLEITSMIRAGWCIRTDATTFWV